MRSLAVIYSGQDFADTGKAFLIEHVDVFQEQHFHLQELPYLLHWLPKVDFGFTLTIKFKERMNCTCMNVSSLDSNAPVGKANISSTMCDKSILASGLIYTSVCAFIMVCLCVCGIGGAATDFSFDYRCRTAYRSGCFTAPLMHQAVEKDRVQQEGLAVLFFCPIESILR